MTPALGLDTGVMVAAVLGGPDQYWQDWVRFDGREVLDRFLPKSALEEFTFKVDGIGSEKSGLLQEILSDGFLAIFSVMGREPDSISLATLNLGYNRTQRVARMLPVLKGLIEGTWDSNLALDELRKYDATTFARRKAFLDRHLIYEPRDEAQADRLNAGLLGIIPGGGHSWKWDCKILSQVGMYNAERSGPVDFVTEDRTHMRPHSAAIRAQTGIRTLRTLAGIPI
jgi:hypothetical protein